MSFLNSFAHDYHIKRLRLPMNSPSLSDTISSKVA
nr:MAG TPA: hypothetical protein [Caudoviricetes sp.]DAS72123.1 MAG TPA: hypothetical protein [Caudoviricetes sp.]